MIEIILISSLICTAIHVASFEGMVGFWFRVVGDMYLPKSVRKPLYECLPCMASFWGTLSLLMLFTTFEINYGVYLHRLVLCILAVSGLNAIIATILNSNETEDNTEDYIAKPDDQPLGI